MIINPYLKCPIKWINVKAAPDNPPVPLNLSFCALCVCVSVCHAVHNHTLHQLAGTLCAPSPNIPAVTSAVLKQHMCLIRTVLGSTDYQDCTVHWNTAGAIMCVRYDVAGRWWQRCAFVAVRQAATEGTNRTADVAGSCLSACGKRQLNTDGTDRMLRGLKSGRFYVQMYL